MKHETIIEAGKTESQYIKDIWHYKDLFYFLAWRDVLVKYKQTVIGVAWAVIRPLLTAIVFTIIFGKVAKLPADGNVPYPVMVFAAMLPWQFFASSLSESSNSVIANANMVSKIYFPRLIIPISAVIVCFVDFIISFVLMLGVMAWYGFMPDIKIFLMPLFLIMAILAAIGPSLWLAALNVKFRDFRYIVPFLVQFGLYVSPVGFSTSVVPEKWRLLYSLNPMVGVIDGFRWCLLGGESQMYWPGLWLSLSLVFIMFFSGLWYFRKTEKSFADFI
ncbi:ABC transporter permease [Lentisphaera profundi]|uniref:Transport permease protein n=1 Tax=Lentisphaera profundi TaxID=1658616 RepID=A0ABY7VT99_9BACT|nr:ABC transporter permease [Lentisphaera profundi]WDE95979.1 ABC transporter permease [Lentisphaera profundi]